MGSRFYFSPEVMNESSYSYPADIFSLGLILYELCTFERFLAPKMQNQIYNNQELEIPDLGPEYKNAEKILQDMLVLNPADRCTIGLVIKNIDRAYPELKPNSLPSSSN